GSPTELVPLCAPPDLSSRVQELEAQLASAQAELSTCRADLKLSADNAALMTAQVRQLQTLLADCRAENCPSKGLPDTGQTQCYDLTGRVVSCAGAAQRGQDAHYATGCPSQGRYIDNGDGTVTDLCTGLMWQKDTADTNGDGKVNLLD